MAPAKPKFPMYILLYYWEAFFYNFFTLVCVCLVNIYTKWINILGILFLSLSFVLSPSLSMVMIMALRGMDEMLNIDPV